MQVKKTKRHQSQAEKSAANFEPLFKSLAATRALMGIPSKELGYLITSGQPPVGIR